VTVLVVIVGATGTGKSELSLDVAERLVARGTNAEIVNADAMQLYRGMDIGTAKLGIVERRGIPHHLLDVLEPVQEASVSDYQLQARAAIDDIVARGATPILVGGSGLYVSSVIQDFQFPGTDPAIRGRWEERLRAEGPGALYRLLLERDPVAAASIGSSNGRRIVRALEVIELTGEPFGAGLPENSAPWREHVTIGLQSPRDQLVERLYLRVERMWEAGLVDEVERLRPGGFGVTASRAIGYSQAIAQLNGELSSVQAIEQTAALTRRYARRQVGWFRRYREAHWCDATDAAEREFAIALAVGKS
jgi:tRNA dimethylallyltransferase